jgi:hypothetical protein
MSEKHIVVNGATCKCNFSLEPKTDKLKVLSQKIHYANDKNGSDKLIASTMDIGQTLEKNTFGKCKLQPTNTDYLPCMATIIKWSGFYKDAILSNQGNILLEDSKATCPIGGPDCISITKHGQKAEGGDTFKNTNKAVAKQLNPLVNISKVQSTDNNDTILILNSK